MIDVFDVDEVEIELGEVKVVYGSDLPTELNITPTTENQVITPEYGFMYNKVNVDAVTSSIDSNIQSKNIIQGITILGVDGEVDVHDYKYKGTIKLSNWIQRNDGNYSYIIRANIHSLLNPYTSYFVIIDDSIKKQCLYGFNVSSNNDVEFIVSEPIVAEFMLRGEREDGDNI